MTGIKSSNKEHSPNGYRPKYQSHIEEKDDISIAEFRANVEMMNRIMNENIKDMEKGGKDKKKKKPPSDSFIDGNFLSAVFAVVFLMIIVVSIYAFYNLFIAVLKKFPSKHTEL